MLAVRIPHSRTGCWLSVAALVAGLSLSPTPARALPRRGEPLTFIVGGLVGYPLAAGSFVTAMANGVAFSGGRRSGSAWRTAGYVLGGLSLVAGVTAFFIQFNSPGWDFLNSPTTDRLAFALPPTLLGAARLGVAIWNSRLPEGAPQASAEHLQLTLEPSFARDSTGHVAPGVALRLLNF
jgi:hypothetical protein